MITIRMIYEKSAPEERYKVLIDRLWPRGISKEKAGWDEWMKDVAPSNELRKWYNHDPARWKDFKKRYKIELSDKQAELKKLKQLEKLHGHLTLLFSSKEEEYNHAVALRGFLGDID
jgi:uncharacterized protein YeaO (DUF488 family)